LAFISCFGISLGGWFKTSYYGLWLWRNPKWWSFGGQVSFGDIRDINALSRVLVMDMISNAGGLNRNGLLEWIIQRITSVVITAYIFFVTYYLLAHPDISYSQWRDLNSLFLMKILNILMISSIAIHSIIGLWGVITDYITVRLLGPKAKFLSVFFQAGMIIITLIYFFWAITIVWSV
jgi:succinate dehydrogenase / fumarate reductase membrane anchor subunit